MINLKTCKLSIMGGYDKQALWIIHSIHSMSDNKNKLNKLLGPLIYYTVKTKEGTYLSNSFCSV